MTEWNDKSCFSSEVYLNHRHNLRSALKLTTETSKENKAKWLHAQLQTLPKSCCMSDNNKSNWLICKDSEH